jgi:hypothetical protein
VQALPSLHDVPLALAGVEHTPVAASQVPASWHWSGAAQVTGLAPVQVPAWHVSVCVQALPSLHEEPLVFGGLLEHTPVAGLQVPASWHWSGAAHITGLAPVQVPDWHVSACVQALLSLHAVPFGVGAATHAPVPTSHAAMAPHIGKRLSPLVCTGVCLLMVVPSPS